MKFKLGLTGSIGMGKSTTAQLFVDAGCVLWDADAAVHRLYAQDGQAVAPIAKLAPEVVIEGQVSRPHLRTWLSNTPNGLEQLEAIVHPLVQADRQAFVTTSPDTIGVFDIPLLFETGGDADMDATVCVTVDSKTQHARVLSRGTMSAADLDKILSRQMPNAEKCRRATYVIQTDTLEHARVQVQTVMTDIQKRIDHA